MKTKKTGGGETWHEMARELAGVLEAFRVESYSARLACEQFARLDDKRRARIAKLAATRARFEPSPEVSR